MEFKKDYLQFCRKADNGVMNVAGKINTLLAAFI